MNDTSGLGRFVRRLIICGIKRNNVQGVYESLNGLLPICQGDAVLIHFAMFKVSLLS